MNAPMESPEVPSDEYFLREALRALPVCIERCTCPDHWHPLWVGLKGTGLLRGVYHQASLLKDLLTPYWKPGARVLIAGAADSGTLDVLNALFPHIGVQITVSDRCAAPLELVRQTDLPPGSTLCTRQTDIQHDEVAAERWDIVFIHYTLSFLDEPGRARYFHQLKASLAPDGIVLCATRFPDPPGASVSQDLDHWIEATGQRLREYYDDQGQLLEALLRFLPAYASSRQQREQTMPHACVLRTEFAAVGLEIVHATEILGPTPSARGDLPRQGNIKSQLFLLR